MREALIVAMHDSKNMVYVEAQSIKLMATGIAPGYRSLFKDVVSIECGWWHDRIKIHVVNKDGLADDHTILLYRGSYTAVLVPSIASEPEAQTLEGVYFGGTAFEGEVIKDWVEKQEDAKD